MQKFIKKYSVFVIISLFISIYFELYREMRAHFITGQFFDLLNNEFNLRIFGKLLLFFVCALIVLLLINHFKHLFIYIDKYRYIIGIAIIALCTIFELSGSSIGNYYTYLEGEYHTSNELFQQGTLLGIPREIRTDEWLTLTPMNFAQQYNDYNSTSDILRGTPTDVTTFYANPSFSVSSIFRPFLWGYILFGNAKGLAFFWSARTVCLFLVSYEFGKILTKEKKLLSIAYACLITFSQTIQWWYSTNGLVEMFIFGQLAIVLLNSLFYTNKKWLKVLICLGLFECAGGYLLVYYPAQQVPLGYVFGVFALHCIITNRKSIKPRDIAILTITVFIFLVCAFYVLYNSMDTINATMSTIYPGKRINTGGNANISNLFSYILSIFTPITTKDIIPLSSNEVESSVFYSLFPVGIIYSLYIMIQKKKADFLYIALLAVELFLIIYCFWGIPELIAKISMLSNSFYSRILEIIGFIDILLLIRCLSEKKLLVKQKKISQIIATYILSLLSFLLSIQILYKYEIRPLLIFWIVAISIIAWILYLIIRNTSEHKEKLAITLICIVTISGLAINPLQKGINVIYNNETVRQISDIKHKDTKALWIVISDKVPLHNLPIMVGAKTINSTNTYPNLEMWKKIDPEEKYSNIYNRYAHINADISESETAFQLLQADLFKVNLNQNDIKKLNVSYILSDKYLNQYEFELICHSNNHYIYKVL